MTRQPLSSEDFALLQEVLQARACVRVDEVLAKLRANALARADRIWLCELIGAEFVTTGLGADSEPTARGQRLERLIDTINRPNIADR